MKVLVTGGNRYIGLELVRALVAAGHEVTVINSHAAPLPAGVRRLEADRRQPGALAAALAPHRDAFDAVFDHTAYTTADIEPMIELFHGRVAHYIFTSSQAVYRRNFVQPLTETARRHAADDEDPRKAYGVGKVRCEDRLLALARDSGFPATCLRVGHTMGPRSPAPTRDPAFFARLEAGRPILIPGEGFAALQVIHIRDVAALMVALLGNSRAHGEAYNVTGGEITSIVGMVQLMARALGVRPNIVQVPMDIARAQRPPLVHWGEALTGTALMSIRKAEAHLGWRPVVGIEAGYRDSYEWYCRSGRQLYEFDFSRDEALLQHLAGSV